MAPDSAGAAAEPRASPSRWPTASAAATSARSPASRRSRASSPTTTARRSLVGEDLRAARALRRPIPGCTRRRGGASIRYEHDKGYVCTLQRAGPQVDHRASLPCRRCAHLSAVAAGARAADRRSSRRRVVGSRAIWAARSASNQQVEIDYRALPIEPGDIFVLTTDGVLRARRARASWSMRSRRNAGDLDAAARASSTRPSQRGSDRQPDRPDRPHRCVPDGEAAEISELAELPLPPLLEPRQVFDGYRIVRELHASSRSHVYLAIDTDGETVALKMPSIDLRDDPAYLERS